MKEAGNLILTRNAGDSVMIGDDIEVIVLATKERQVRLSFRVPRSVAVHRKEIWNRIQGEKKDAE